MAIHQIYWRNLDDPFYGIPIDMVDWTGCPIEVKLILIEDYNMSRGYQPNVSYPEKKTEAEKEYWYDKVDRNVDVGMYSLGWLGYLPMVYFLLWPILMAKGLSIGAAIFISLVCILPWVIFSVLVGGALALLTGIIAYGIHYPFLRKSEKKEAKQKEFDKFIKGCRNGHN